MISKSITLTETLFNPVCFISNVSPSGVRPRLRTVGGSGSTALAASSMVFSARFDSFGPSGGLSSGVGRRDRRPGAGPSASPRPGVFFHFLEHFHDPLTQRKDADRQRVFQILDGGGRLVLAQQARLLGAGRQRRRHLLAIRADHHERPLPAEVEVFRPEQAFRPPAATVLMDRPSTS